MLRKIPLAAWLAVPVVYVLYFYHLGAAGLVGPDEPRYASIGREMARSGDWITPRLWGQPWFEKPALLYWMQAAAFRLGLGTELAPRLPVALLAVAFLVFYWWILRCEFGARAAWMATLILATSAAWLVASQIGVTDLPLTATFAAGMLLALPWVARGDTKWLPWSAALLGLAALAKGLVPVALAVPLLFRKNGLRDLLRLRVVLPFLVVSLPWYALCYARNGNPFLYEFFWRHHVERVVSGGLMHVQPWWFYVPVLLGSLLPWTPLLALLGTREAYRDPRRLFLLSWVVFGFVVFSIATNKLPGYLLPLIPAAAALLGIAVERNARPAVWLALSAALLIVFPAALPVLPAAVAEGLSHAPLPTFQLSWLVPIALAAAVFILAGRSRRLAAVASIAAGVVVGIVYLKSAALPALDTAASARSLWHEIGDRAPQTCLAPLPRAWQYGLNYYSVAPLPECARQPRPWQVLQGPGERPSLTPAPVPGVPSGSVKQDPGAAGLRLTPSRSAL